MIIFGEHGLQIFDPAHLTGKHNQHLQNKLFLFADEAFWAGDRTAERTLKGVVTEKRMMIEPKGVNAFPWPNRLSIYMAANADWVVPASHDERRYAVGNVNERWKQNEDYFIPLFAEIKAGGAAAMLYDKPSTWRLASKKNPTDQSTSRTENAQPHRPRAMVGGDAQRRRTASARQEEPAQS
jgi:hypothetical protein